MSSGILKPMPSQPKAPEQAAPQPLKTIWEELQNLAKGDRREILLNTLPTLVCRYDELVKEKKILKDEAWERVVELAKVLK